MTTSGENTRELRAVSYSPVGDEIIPSDANNISLLYVMWNACNLRESSFSSVQV